MSAISIPETVARIRVSSECDLQKIRPVTKSVRDFLAKEGATDEELGACELALVEACNNAVLYATKSGQAESVDIEASLDQRSIEMRVHDHTNGFTLPDLTNLPAQENESGRGIFLMRSLMDSVSYMRNAESNTLILQKRRQLIDGEHDIPAAMISDLKVQLSESEQIITDMTNELSSCYESLSAIFRAGAELGKTNNLAEFTQSLGKELLDITGSDWFVLRIVPKETSQLKVFASHPEIALAPLPVGIFLDSDITAEMKAAVSGRDVWFNPRNPLQSCDPLKLAMPGSFGLVHPFFFGDTLMGTLTVGKFENRAAFNAANAQVVRTFAGFLGIQIANAQMREEQLSHQIVAHELQIARNIQRALLPRALPRFKGVNLSGFYESARQVGGDFYDVLPVGNDCLILMIADVMGKGVPAAMFAAIFRSLLRSNPELNDQPGPLLARVNRLLYNDLSDVDMFITAQLIFVDLQNRTLKSASAGHCPALLSGLGSEVKVIIPEGLPIGILPDAEFPETNEVFPEGGRILVYTDGLTETRNASGEFFGQDRLVQWLSENRQKSTEQLKNSLGAHLAQFRGNTPLQDDQTFLLLAEEKE
jgi:serine phosphatase RsbU (regulator of sigma subunit)/anti-sigma regulatory factor (Ser/Thr protein kinase)